MCKSLIVPVMVVLTGLACTGSPWCRFLQPSLASVTPEMLGQMSLEASGVW